MFSLALLALLGPPGSSWPLLGFLGFWALPMLSCAFLGVLAFWTLVVPPGRSWALLGLPRPSWTLLGRPGLSWLLLGSPGPSWTALGSPRPSWALLAPSELSQAFMERANRAAGYRRSCDPEGVMFPKHLWRVQLAGRAVGDSVGLRASCFQSFHGGCSSRGSP